MALTDGESAEPWDIWVRIITSPDYVKPDGTLHNKAFTGKTTLAPPQGTRPWSVELSGGLLCLIGVGELAKYGTDACGDRFSGFMFQRVENLRCEASGYPTDVVYTPNADVAHADLAFFHIADFTPEIRFALRDWLQDLLCLAGADKLDTIEYLGQTAA